MPGIGATLAYQEINKVRGDPNSTQIYVFAVEGKLKEFDDLEVNMKYEI